MFFTRMLVSGKPHVAAAGRPSRGCRGCGAGKRGSARCRIRAQARAHDGVWRGGPNTRCCDHWRAGREEEPEVVVSRIMMEEVWVVSVDDC
eukprot:343122-Chlamydomonas_euryale.AAC.3